MRIRSKEDIMKVSIEEDFKEVLIKILESGVNFDIVVGVCGLYVIMESSDKVREMVDKVRGYEGVSGVMELGNQVMVIFKK